MRQRLRVRNAIVVVSVVLLSTLAGLLIAEIVVRLSGLAPEIFAVQKGRFRISENPLIGYELVPHFESDRAGSMLDFRGKANSLGFRDREHAVEKPEGIFRMLVIGDSVTQGLGVKDDEAVFTSVLERELNERPDGRVEVLNFGVSGYNTQQEVETLRHKGVDYEPDLVILAYCSNDTRLHSGGILPQLSGERNKLDRPPRILLSSALFRLVYTRLASPAMSERDLFPEIKKNTVSRYLDVLANLSRRVRFDVLIVSFPRLDGHVDEDSERDFSLLKEAASRHGFHFLDLADAFAGCAADGEIAWDPIHPNAEGHRCAGEAIADYADSRRIIRR